MYHVVVLAAHHVGFTRTVGDARQGGAGEADEDVQAFDNELKQAQDHRCLVVRRL